MFQVRRNGMTFVELMVVMAIIALLAAMAGPAIIRHRIHTNEKATLSNMRSLTAALELYGATHLVYNQPSYPDTVDEMTVSLNPSYMFYLDDSWKQSRLIQPDLFSFCPQALAMVSAPPEGTPMPPFATSPPPAGTTQPDVYTPGVKKVGYIINYQAVDLDGDGCKEGYAVDATPARYGSTGIRSFYTNDKLVIYAQDNGGLAYGLYQPAPAWPIEE